MHIQSINYYEQNSGYMIVPVQAMACGNALARSPWMVAGRDGLTAMPHGAGTVDPARRDDADWLFQAVGDRAIKASRTTPVEEAGR